MTNQQSAIGNDSISPWLVAWICLALVLMVAAVFGQSLGFGFLTHYDDDANITQASCVSSGLSVEGVLEAFTHARIDRWTPLTMVSHQFDCQIFGLRAGGHHLSNLLLHAAATVAIFLALRSLTSALWKSAFVAGVFALHPQHVEPVCWLSARSEILGGLFFALTLLAYARYVRSGCSWRGFLPVAVCLGLGLLCKQMLVTVPLVLLLLDYWPLQRTKEGKGLFSLMKEKIPLFLLSIFAGVASLLSLNQTQETTPSWLTLELRLCNAPVAYLNYLKSFLWPENLAAYYPMPEAGWPSGLVSVSITVLLGMSATVLFLRQKRPYLFTGWFWFLGMLLPVIGIVGNGGIHAYADRYTYLPQIGLCLAGTWIVSDWAGMNLKKRRIVAVMASLILILLGFLSLRQASYWRDTRTLMTREVECTGEGNLSAQYYLGCALMDEGRFAEAESHLRKSMAQPEFTPVAAHSGLAVLLEKQGRIQEAYSEYQIPVRMDPDNAIARYDLANFLFQHGDPEQSGEQYRKALALDPKLSEAHNNFAAFLLQQGNVSEALIHFQSSADLEPGNPSFIKNLAWVLSTASRDNLRDGKKGLQLALKINRQTEGKDPLILRTLAAAYAETGDYTKALETAHRALALAQQQGNKELSENLRTEIAFYEAGKPCRDPR